MPGVHIFLQARDPCNGSWRLLHERRHQPFQQALPPHSLSGVQVSLYWEDTKTH